LDLDAERLGIRDGGTAKKKNNERDLEAPRQVSTRCSREREERP
jgi:hypothetical protein